MAYVLENEAESGRLEKQAEGEAYSLLEELGDVALSDGERVLDAGCGTGLVSRFLAERFPGARIEACDMSELRLAEAKRLRSSPAHHLIRFFESDVQALKAPDAAYDRIFVRYVFEHLSRPELAARELLRALAPGGSARIVNFDGVIANLSSPSPRLASQIRHVLGAQRDCDVLIGRRIPGLLVEAGFSRVEWSVKAYAFQGKELEAERELTWQRLGFALPLLRSILGSEAEACAFRELYCEEMMRPGATIFYNKFVVEGSR
jgi:SAM-dependent methyltransferase